MEQPNDETASSLALVKLICRDFSNNEEIQTLMRQITDVEKEVVALEAREKSLRERKAALQLQSVTLDMIHELRQPDREQEEKSLSPATECYEAFLRLVQQLQSFDLGKIGKYDQLVGQTEMEKELKGMVDYYNEIKAVADAMEQRNIVQQLRKEQATLAAVKREYDEEVRALDLETRKEKTLLAAEQQKTNEYILTLVKNAKTIQDLEDQLYGAQNAVQEAKTSEEESLDVKEPFSINYERYLSNANNPFLSVGEERELRPFPKLFSFSTAIEGDQGEKSPNQMKQYSADKQNHFAEFNEDKYFLADVTKNLSLDGRSSKESSKVESARSEKSVGETSENILEKTLENTMDKTMENALEKLSEKTLEKFSENLPDKTSETTLEKTSGNTLEKISEQMRETTSEATLQTVLRKTWEHNRKWSPYNTPERASENNTKKSPERTAEKAPERTQEKGPQIKPGKRPEITPEKGPQITLERRPEITPENIPVITPEKVPVITPEKTPEQMLSKSPQKPTNMDESPKSVGNVEILECRAMKPAGTALPQALSLTFSPNSMKFIESLEVSPSTSKYVPSLKEMSDNEQSVTSPRDKYLNEQPSTSRQVKKNKVKVLFNFDEVEKMLMEPDLISNASGADEKLSELEFGSPGNFNIMSNFASPMQGFTAEENFTLDFDESTEFNSDFL